MKPLMLSALIVVFSIAALDVYAQISSTSNNVMENFSFTSCTKTECLEVKAPKAWLSLASGGFTTEGTTTVRILEPFGELRSSRIGTTATLNPNLEVLVLEKESNGVELFSLTAKKTGEEK
jgi:hypothetical protein